MSKRLTEGQIENMKSMWEQGAKVQQIAYLIGCSQPTVYVQIKKWSNPEPELVTFGEEFPTVEAEKAMADYEMPDEKISNEGIEASNYFNKPEDRSHGNTEYHTKDMFLITVLLMYGFIPLYVSKEQYSKYARFSFEKSPKLYAVTDAFFANLLTVQANPYIQCYKALKNVVLNEEEMVTVPLVERVCADYIGVHNIPA